MDITHNNFVGVQFDAKAVEAIKTIADGLNETAKALGALATVLKASNVHIETMASFSDQHGNQMDIGSPPEKD